MGIDESAGRRNEWLTGTGTMVPVSHTTALTFLVRLLVVFSGFCDVGLVACFCDGLYERLRAGGSCRLA